MNAKQREQIQEAQNLLRHVELELTDELIKFGVQKASNKLSMELGGLAAARAALETVA